MVDNAKGPTGDNDGAFRKNNDSENFSTNGASDCTAIGYLLMKGKLAEDTRAMVHRFMLWGDHEGMTLRPNWYEMSEFGNFIVLDYVRPDVEGGMRIVICGWRPSFGTPPPELHAVFDKLYYGVAKHTTSITDMIPSRKAKNQINVRSYLKRMDDLRNWQGIIPSNADIYFQLWRDGEPLTLRRDEPGEAKA